MKRFILSLLLLVTCAVGFAQAPRITSFTPAAAKPGDVVTLTGTGFNATAANNVVFFGATRGTVTAASATSVTVTVPTGATYAPITLLNAGSVLACASVSNFNPIYAPAKTNITASDFLPKVDFATGTNPFSVAIGDLDGDGKPDLVVANFNSDNVSVLRNTSASGSIAAGSFAPKVDFATGVQPRSVAIGDLNGDSKPDLVVANASSDNISVLRNTSSSGSITAGSFAPKVDFATGDVPSSVAIGDLDGDGKPDLAMANEVSNNVSVLRNTSSSGSITAGSFAPTVDFAAGGAPRSVAIGDLEGDGKPDLVVANLFSNTVSVLRNTSTSGSITAGSFAPTVDFATGGGPVSVAIGDLDGDGKPDLAVANSGSISVSVLRNTSSSGSITAGSFAPIVNFATGFGPRSVAIGDLDGDGKPDLAVVNEFSSTVSVLRNTSASGSITASSFAPKVDFATGVEPYSVAIGDLDGDGKPDLAAANLNSSTVSVLRNADIVSLVPAITSFTPTAAKPGDVVTLTGTGFNATAANNVVFFGATRATVTAASATSVTVTVPSSATYAPITLLNTGSVLACASLSNFNPIYAPAKTNITASDFLPNVDFATGTNPYSVAIGDLDGDGKSDLAVVNNSSQTVSVYRNISASGSITAGSFAPKVDFATGDRPSSVAIGDLDGDGKPDLAVANTNSNTVSVLRNTSFSGSIIAGSFAPKVDFATGLGPWSVAIGDLDGDGKPDLAVANNISNTFSVLRNTSSAGSITAGSFAPKVDFATGGNPFSVAIGDLDGDGKPDLAVPNEGDNTVSVYRNTSASGSIAAGSFAPRVDFATGGSPFSVAIGDLDGGGKPDLAVANSGSNTVSILHNTSASGSIAAGSFAPKVDFATGVNPISVAIGDLDGDGKPDLAVANQFSSTVSVLRNTSASGSITAGSFAPKVDFATGVEPISVAIGDLDRDGKPDLVVANLNSDTVSVLRNADIVSLVTAITSFTPTFGCALTSSVTITGTNFTGATAVSIGGTAATSFTVNSATQITATVGNGTTGTIQVTTPSGTGVSSGTFTVNTPTASITGNNTICSGASSTFTASVGASYVWSTGASTAAITVTTAGTYTVTVTNALGCTATADRTLIVNASPTVSIAGNNTICSGASSTFTASGGASYAWSTGASTAAITVTTAGTYTVTATNASGCTATADKTLTVNAIAALDSISGPQVVDTLQDYAYFVPVDPAATFYDWYSPCASVVFGQGTNSVNVEWDGTDTCTLYVAVGNSGCADTVSLTVYVLGATGIAELLTEDRLALYPNPTNGLATLSWGAPLNKLPTVYLVDALGKKLVVPINCRADSCSIDVRDLAAGVYQVVVSDAEGNAVLKLVKSFD